MITAGRLVEDDDIINDEKDRREKYSIKSELSDGNDKDKYFRLLSEREEEKSNESIPYWTIMKRTVKLAKPEWCDIILACSCSCLIGASVPIYAVFFGDFFGVSCYIRIMNDFKHSII